MSRSISAPEAKKYIQLAKSLPEQLKRFLARYPPPQILGHRGPVTGYQLDHPNPFVPTRHPVTRRLHDPVYSMRRQADLVKQARKYGIEALLPWSKKKTEVRLAKKVEFGSRVKGTGVGQRVKGHKFERDLGKKYVDDPSLIIRVTVVVGARERRRRQRRRRRRLPGTRWADLLIQDGNEERSYAQHAGAHQGMESGTFTFVIPVVSTTC